MPAESEFDNPAVRPRQSITLTESECWKLLSSVSLGRVVFTMNAMPAIRPVNHLVDGHTVVLRSHLGASIVSRATAGERGPGEADEGTVVCYEADDLDPFRHTGWSVIVTGLARLVREPAAIARYSASLEPWIAGEMDHVIAIEARYITGIRLVGWCE